MVEGILEKRHLSAYSMEKKENLELPVLSHCCIHKYGGRDPEETKISASNAGS